MSPRITTPSTALGVALTVLVTGCYVDRTPPPRFAGDAAAPPSIGVLPSAESATSAFTDRMRFGLTLAEESLSLEAPAPPPSRAAASFVRWSSTELRRWLARKSHTVDAARQELDAAAEQDHRQRIVAGAVVGLLYEDVARALKSLPAPLEIERDPEAAQLYREVLDGKASPFLEHAQAAYLACAQNGRFPADMRHWSRFCAARADRLVPGGVVDDLAPGETRVEVVAH